jgi:hypothetical protein
MKIKMQNQLYTLDLDKVDNGVVVGVSSPINGNFILVKPDELPNLIGFLQKTLREFENEN